MLPLLVWRGYWIDGENVMSGFKGTPGPWELMKDDDELKVIQAGSLEKGFGWKSYCNVCDGVSGGDDARLIAAAPELLEALMSMVSRIEYYATLADANKPNIEDWAYTYNSTDMDVARQAIDKALGR